MRRPAELLAALLLTMTLGVGLAEPALSNPASATIPVSDLKAGDVLTQPENGGWATVKILAVEPWPDGSAVAHVLSYARSPTKPTLESSQNLTILIGHAPIDAASLTTGYELLGNVPPTEKELMGYRRYLEAAGG